MTDRTINIRVALEWFAMVRHIKHVSRFEPQGAHKAFLDAWVGVLLKLAKQDMPAGTVLYRARANDPKDDSAIQPVGRKPKPRDCSEMGAPPPAINPGGRLNPPGMSFLYLAETPNGAVSELRPWRGAEITVATFITSQDTTIIGLAEPDLQGVDDKNTREAFRTISMMLSVPHHENEHGASAGTQLFAAALRNAGANGIRYESAASTGNGANVVLFDPGHAQADSASVYRVRDSSYEIKQVTDGPA